MKKLLTQFKDDQSGAVTVDWIVLTAGIVGIGVTMASTLDAGLQSVASSIFDNINAILLSLK